MKTDMIKLSKPIDGAGLGLAWLMFIALSFPVALADQGEDRGERGERERAEEREEGERRERDRDAEGEEGERRERERAEEREEGERRGDERAEEREEGERRARERAEEREEGERRRDERAEERQQRQRRAAALEDRPGSPRRESFRRFLEDRPRGPFSPGTRRGRDLEGSDDWGPDPEQFNHVEQAIRHLRAAGLNEEAERLLQRLRRGGNDRRSRAQRDVDLRREGAELRKRIDELSRAVQTLSEQVADLRERGGTRQ